MANPTWSGDPEASTASRTPPGAGPAGMLGPLIPRPRRRGVPSARHLPSLVRGGMRVVGFVWKTNRGPSHRQEGWNQTNDRSWLSGSCLLLRHKD